MIRPNCRGRGVARGGGRTYYIKVFEANNDLANGDYLFGCNIETGTGALFLGLKGIKNHIDPKIA